jgi:hypothetical protein
MKPSRSLADEAACKCHGIASLDGDPIPHALMEANGASVEDVDGRNDLERQSVLTCYHANMLS